MRFPLLVQNPPATLSQDQFLYSCRQALSARTTKQGFDSHIRHEPFLFRTFDPGRNLSVGAFRQNLKEIFRHTHQVTPQFRRLEEINLDTISFFSLAIATLVADLETLMKFYGGTGLPPVLGLPREKKDHDKLPALALLFERHEAFIEDLQAAEAKGQDETPEYLPFPLNPSESQDAEAIQRDRVAVSDEVWGTIFGLVRTTFPKHHRAIAAFLNWHFQPEVPAASIDWRVRPPVGEAFQHFLRSLQSGARAGASFAGSGPGGRNGRTGGPGPSGTGGGSRGDRDRPKRSEEREPQGQDQRAHREKHDFEISKSAAGEPRIAKDAPAQMPLKARTPTLEREAAPAGERHSGAEPRSPRPPKPQRAPRSEGDQGGDAPSSAAAIEEATKEVEHSIRILQKNSKRPGIRLAPQNSFIRRQQHMVAEELGFETESVGEARDRAVYIKNKEKAESKA
jgi:hypothetical protein